MGTKICYLDYIQTTSVQQNWKIRIPWKHRISTCFFGWWRSSNLPPKKIPPKVSFCWFGWDVSFMDLGRFCGKSFKAPPGWAGKCGHHRPLARYLCSTFIPSLAGFAITKGSWWLRIPVNKALFLGGEQWQGVSLAVVFVKVPTLTVPSPKRSQREYPTTPNSQRQFAAYKGLFFYAFWPYQFWIIGVWRALGFDSIWHHRQNRGLFLGNADGVQVWNRKGLTVPRHRSWWWWWWVVGFSSTP